MLPALVLYNVGIFKARIVVFHDFFITFVNEIEIQSCE